MAASMSCWVSISTKPKPRERPVSRSLITSAERTVPWAENSSLRSSELTDQARLPTYIFFDIRTVLTRAKRKPPRSQQDRKKVDRESQAELQSHLRPLE